MTMIATDKKPEATFAFAAFLAFLAMLGPFSIDAYLPAFPTLAADFGVSPAYVQQTLTAYFAAFALMNLFHGTISDALGRRWPMLIALSVYTVASLGCMFAESINALLFFRAIQGLSAGAGVIAFYTITRDCFEGAAVQKVMAYGTVIYNIAPVLAPVLGGLLLTAFGWRSVFGLLAALGLTMLTTVLWRLPETLPDHLRQSAKPKAIVANFRRVLRHRDTYLLTGTVAFSFTAGFLYILASSAFLTRHLGLGNTEFAWLFLPLVRGYVLGALLSGWLAPLLTRSETTWWGFRLMSIAVGVNVLLSYAKGPSLPCSIVPLFFYAIGQGLAGPALKSLLSDLFPSIAGTAAALRGSMQWLLLAFVAGVVVPKVSASVVDLALAMMCLFLLGGACWFLFSIRASAPVLDIQRM